MKTSIQLRKKITELQKQLTLAEQAEQQIDAAADAGIPPSTALFFLSTLR